MVEIIAAVVANIGFIGILFRWQHVQIRDNKLELARIASLVYSKEETNGMIDLKLQPLVVGISHVQADVTEMKHMIGRLLDEKNKG